MRSPIGAPEDGISRRQFLAATGAAGPAGTAGCVTATKQSVGNVTVPTCGSSKLGVPETSRLEVADLWKRGNEVTLKPVKASTTCTLASR